MIPTSISMIIIFALVVAAVILPRLPLSGPQAAFEPPVRHRNPGDYDGR